MSTLGEALLEARRYCINKDDPCCPEEPDFHGPVSPQNEAASLSQLLQKGPTMDQAARAELDGLCNTYLERTASNAQAGPSGRPFPEGSKEEKLLSWCKSQGLITCISPATFEGGLRGTQADTDIKAGGIACSIPAPCLISYRTAAESDLGKALQKLPLGLSEEVLAVVWTMVDRTDPDSHFAPFWDSMPAHFNTALSMPGEQLETCLEGSSLLSEARQARQHIQEQYAQLSPILQTLARAYPQFITTECVSWESYLWAVECWYAYALQVQADPSNPASTCPCLVPFVGLINHSPWPHAVHFSTVDAKTRRLNVRSFRPCKSGQQFFISYGPLSNAKLLLFYGFSVAGNPYDCVNMNMKDLAARVSCKDAQQLLLMDTGLEFRLSKAVPIPKQLLAASRFAAMSFEQRHEAQQQQQQQQQQQRKQGNKGAPKKNKAGKESGDREEGGGETPLPQGPVSPANEAAALQLLRRVLEGKREVLQAQAERRSTAGACSGASGFAEAAEVYMQGQREVLDRSLYTCMQLANKRADKDTAH